MRKAGKDRMKIRVTSRSSDKTEQLLLVLLSRRGLRYRVPIATVSGPKKRTEATLSCPLFLDRAI